MIRRRPPTLDRYQPNQWQGESGEDVWERRASEGKRSASGVVEPVYGDDEPAARVTTSAAAAAKVVVMVLTS